MNAYVIALLAVGIIYIVFGLYVFLKRKADSIGSIFFSIALCIAAWNLSIALIESKVVSSKLGIIVFDRIGCLVIPIAITSIIFYLVALWGDNWWDRAKKNKIIVTLAIFGLLIVFLSPTNLLSNNQGETHLIFGPLVPLLGAYVLATSIYIVYFCYIGWKRGPEESRKKFWFVMIGYILAALCGLIFNLILPLLGYNSYPMIGALSTIFIVWFVGLGAIGTTIAGSIIGILSTIIAIIFLSLIILGMAIALMFILYAL